MGMYTGLRGKVVFKDKEFAEDLKRELESYDRLNHWQGLSEKYPELEELEKFSTMGRATFIPCGSMCYLDWEDTYSRVQGKVFEFNCSLKNYEGEIETFVEKVLPEIAEDWNLEMQYEEWVEPVSVTKDGGIDKDSIKYDFEDDMCGY